MRAMRENMNKKEISWKRAMDKVEPTGNPLHFVGRWNREAHMVLDEAYYLLIMKKDGKHFEKCWEMVK